MRTTRLPMSLRTKTILILAGTLAFATALYGDIHHWRLRLQDLRIWGIALTILLIVIGGLLIALTPFRNIPYKTKIIVTIPLVSIVFSLYVGWTIMDNEYGFTDRYNYFTAKQDIKKGKVRIITHGLMLSTVEFDQAKAIIDSQFGFRTVWEGCTIENNGWVHYNKVMSDYLDKRNGNKWRVNYGQKIDSLATLLKLPQMK
ncbi:MAG: FEKKY domain-containing protein [Flavisolibacter sp.]